MNVTVIAGGVGAARMLNALLTVVDPSSVTAVVNTGDDTVLHGLHISPDLDTVTYTVAGAIDAERGWGLIDESWNAIGALGRYEQARPDGSAAGSTWFGLGDRDLATHLYRTGRLAEGATLTEVSTEIADAWGIGIRLLPMSNDPAPTRLTIEGGRDVSFQEYFVQLHHDVTVTDVELGGRAASPNPAALAAIADADVIVIAPSNPIVSIGPIRAVPGFDDALRARRDHVVAVSPIVAGAALKGPADRLLRELGHEPSVVGVARIYRPIASAFVIDPVDESMTAEIESVGLRPVVVPSIMSDARRASRLAAATLAAITTPRPS